jgi:FlaG/FlaF family flagellin (archaellin)
MNTTVVRPRKRPITIVAIAIVAVLAATFGALLLFGVFDDDRSEAPRSTAPAVVVVAPSSGGVDQATQQMNERRVQHGAPALLPAAALGHGAAGYDASADSSRAGAPVAGTGGATRHGDTKYDLAHPEDRVYGDTKYDLQNTEDLGVEAARANGYEPTATQIREARRIERGYMSGEEGAGH